MICQGLNMTRLWPPGHDMNWAVAVVVEVTIIGLVVAIGGPAFTT